VRSVGFIDTHESSAFSENLPPLGHDLGQVIATQAWYVAPHLIIVMNNNLLYTGSSLATIFVTRSYHHFAPSPPKPHKLMLSHSFTNREIFSSNCIVESTSKCRQATHTDFHSKEVPKRIFQEIPTLCRSNSKTAPKNH
jgi:hypothetical protein